MNKKIVLNEALTRVIRIFFFLFLSKILSKGGEEEIRSSELS